MRVWNELKLLIRRERKSWRGKLFYDNPGKAQSRKLSRRIQLSQTRDRVCGKTVVDLGCAEGYVAGLLLGRGASLVHGLDRSRRRVRRAAATFSEDDRARFFVADLESGGLDKLIEAGELKPAYDVVVFLSVYQKLRADKRNQILERCLRLCSRTFLCRVPGEFVGEVIASVSACGMRLSEGVTVANSGTMLVFDRCVADQSHPASDQRVAPTPIDTPGSASSPGLERVGWRSDGRRRQCISG